VDIMRTTIRMTVDNTGNVYVVGWSWEGVDGLTLNPPQHPAAMPIVVVKFSSDGIYQWHTYYGRPREKR
jgi:hypothetical protein